MSSSSSSSEAPRCRHIKVNGTQCGSPAVRSNIGRITLRGRKSASQRWLELSVRS
jgi:hypothetical protein